MDLPAILFSIVAAAVAWMVGRRDTASAPRVTAAVLVLLLTTPLLSLLPKLHVLPATTEQAHVEAGSGFALWTTLWLIGASVLLLRLLTASLKLHRWKRDSAWSETLTVHGRRIEIRTLRHLAGPHACGVIRPLILLPEQSANWPAHIRNMVIAHELAHHRRRDPLWRLIAETTCVIHWFNPFVWWLARHHAIQSEFACDAMVVSEGIQPDRYAEALCDLATSEPSMSLAPALNQTSGLKKRVIRLMEPKASSSPLLITALAMLILLLGTSMLILRPVPRGETPPPEEIERRLSADPFPANR